MKPCQFPVVVEIAATETAVAVVLSVEEVVVAEEAEAK